KISGQAAQLDYRKATDGDADVKLSATLDDASRARLGIDLGSAVTGNIPVKSGKATFTVVKKEQSTVFQDISVDGGGVSIKGSLEIDGNGDLLNANFPTYAPSEGDKTSLRAERGADGVVKVTMRGDVFDGRGFLKPAISGKEADPKSKT